MGYPRNLPRAIGSVWLERCLHTAEVEGSNPPSPTSKVPGQKQFQTLLRISSRWRDPNVTQPFDERPPGSRLCLSRSPSSRWSSRWPGHHRARSPSTGFGGGHLLVLEVRRTSSCVITFPDLASRWEGSIRSPRWVVAAVSRFSTSLAGAVRRSSGRLPRRLVHCTAPGGGGAGVVVGRGHAARLGLGVRGIAVRALFGLSPWLWASERRVVAGRCVGCWLVLAPAVG